VAARGPLASRNTNFAACHYGRDGPYCAGEDVLSVRQTGAVQCQRESSTEPHTKNVEMCFHARGEGDIPPVLAIQIGGEAFRQEGVWRY
jgi:hypothetical protein